MFCSKCGKENADGTAYCSGCGNKLESGKTGAVKKGASAKEKLQAIGMVVGVIVLIFFVVWILEEFKDNNGKSEKTSTEKNDGRGAKTLDEAVQQLMKAVKDGDEDAMTSIIDASVSSEEKTPASRIADMRGLLMKGLTQDNYRNIEWDKVKIKEKGEAVDIKGHDCCTVTVTIPIKGWSSLNDYTLDLNFHKSGTPQGERWFLYSIKE